MIKSYPPHGSFQTVRIGNEANNTTFDSRGVQTMTGEAEVWLDLLVPLSQSRPGATNPPDNVLFRDDGDGSQGVRAYAFSATIEEEVEFKAQLSHAWKEGSSIYPHVHWTPSTAGAGNVVWGMELTFAKINGQYPVTVFMSVTAAAGGDSTLHQISGFGELDMTGMTGSTEIACRLFRDATNVADTYAADAFALDVDFHYQINKLGEDGFPGS